MIIALLAGLNALIIIPCSPGAVRLFPEGEVIGLPVRWLPLAPVISSFREQLCSYIPYSDTFTHVLCSKCLCALFKDLHSSHMWFILRLAQYSFRSHPINAADLHQCCIMALHE